MSTVIQQAAPLAPPIPEDPLRYAFVEMLFALAISQVAVHAAELATAAGSLLEKLPAFSHLALSLMVIAASWVGWRQSQSPGMKQQITSLFSRRFLTLMLDVILVIVYFVLVRTVDLQQKDGGVVLSAPSSAAPESRWLLTIFVIYLIWDLISDVFSTDSLTAKGFFNCSWQGLRVAVLCCASSALCAYLCYRALELSATVEGSPVGVALVDSSLLVVVLLFRVIKAFEPPLAKVLKVEGCKAFVARRSARNAIFLSLVLIPIYFGLLWSATSPRLVTCLEQMGSTQAGKNAACPQFLRAGESVK